MDKDGKGTRVQRGIKGWTKTEKGREYGGELKGGQRRKRDANTEKGREYGGEAGRKGRIMGEGGENERSWMTSVGGPVDGLHVNVQQSRGGATVARARERGAEDATLPGTKGISCAA